MNEFDLLKAIGDIDSSYIENVKRGNVRKIYTRTFKIAVVACVSAVMLSGLLIVLPKVINSGKQIKESVHNVVIIENDPITIMDVAEKTDASYEIVYYERAFVAARYTGKKETVEISLEGTPYKRYKYYFDLDTIAANPQDYLIPEEFVLCVGEMYLDMYPEIKEGDRLMVALTKGLKESGYEDNEFIWDLPNVVFRIENDKLKAVFEEDKQYENYTISEFMDELTLTGKAIKKITEDMQNGKLEYDENVGFSIDEYRDVLKRYKNELKK